MIIEGLFQVDYSMDNTVRHLACFFGKIQSKHRVIKNMNFDKSDTVKR